LNNACEVFNNYILEAKEMHVLSMLETMKCKLMTRLYNKEKEVGQAWYGLYVLRLGRSCRKTWNGQTLLSAGQGIFQVQDRDYSFRVDLDGQKCDCRRLDLIGIPCSHAISCLRH